MELIDSLPWWVWAVVVVIGVSMMLINQAIIYGGQSLQDYFMNTERSR